MKNMNRKDTGPGPAAAPGRREDETIEEHIGSLPLPELRKILLSAAEQLHESARECVGSAGLEYTAEACAVERAAVMLGALEFRGPWAMSACAEDGDPEPVRDVREAAEVLGRDISTRHLVLSGNGAELWIELKPEESLRAALEQCAAELAAPGSYFDIGFNSPEQEALARAAVPELLAQLKGGAK